MHKCEFCHKPFIPRPQVKHPRACKFCQKLRQLANEQEWKVQHSGLYDKEYHAIKKQHRETVIIAIAKKLIDCVKVGILLFGFKIEPIHLELCISKLFIRMGIREVNKLWTLKNVVIL